MEDDRAVRTLPHVPDIPVTLTDEGRSAREAGNDTSKDTLLLTLNTINENLRKMSLTMATKEDVQSLKTEMT